MPLYQYTAIDSQKQAVSDSLMAADINEAKQLLTTQGLKIKSIKQTKSTNSFDLLIRKGTPVLEKATLFRYLATMVNAGLSLPESIEVYAQDTQFPRLKKILYHTQQLLQQGKNLSEAFSHYPDNFDKTTISIIKAGEVSGTLTKSLDYLSKQLYSEYKLKQKVKGAMMYPLIIVSAMSGVGLILVFFVLPKIAPIFLQMNLTLPTFSRIILTGGLFISQHATIVLTLLASIVLTVGIGLTRPMGKHIAITIVSIIPAIRNLLDQLDLARFSRTLSTLLASGVPIADALFIVVGSLSQQKYSRLATQFQNEVQKGRPLSEIMRLHKKLFPNMIVRMTSTGEKTGSVDSMLEELANHYENEIDSTLNNFTSILEPVLLLLVGIGVGFMVLAVIAPIYSLVGGIEQSTPGR